MFKVNQIGFIDNNMQGYRVFDSNGLAVTISAQTGGLGGSGVGLYLVKEEGDSLSEVIKYDLALPVTIRKHEVDTDKLRLVLRASKEKAKITNRRLAELVNRPMTEVEHWFRMDNCFSIPDPKLWQQLKEILAIDTDEFDAPITEFIEQPGVFEKANRFYDINGIAPTLTVASADEKIIYVEDDLMSRIMKVGFINRDREQNRVHSIEGIMPTITANNQGGRRPGGLILEPTNKEENMDYQETTEQVINTKPFKYVELFAGIGGFRQALDKLGGECVFASEIDKYAQKSYEVLYGDKAHLHGDITQIAAEDIPIHDVLVGGMPCQAFSIAGKRLGFEDTRGTLFFEMARIAKHHQPKAIFIENVKGLINHAKGDTLSAMLHALNEIGYTIDFNLLNSKFFNVAQSRERIFILAIRNDLVTEEKWTIEGKTIVPKAKERLQEEGIRTFNFEWPEQKEVTTRLRDILEPIVDESYYLNEDKTSKLVAQLEKKYEESVVVHNIYGGFNETKPRIFEDYSPTIRTSAGGGHLPSLLEVQKDDTDDPIMVGKIEATGHDVRKRVYSVDGVSPTPSGLGMGGNTEPKIAEEVKSCSTRTRSYAGQPESLEIRKDDVSNTITSVPKDSYVFESPKYRIRKLTCLECLRLQSFSDEIYYKLREAGLSNSQLYKQAGNAVTVNVVKSVGEKLLKYL